MSTLLDDHRPSTVEFDPTNPDHIDAFRMLCVSRDDRGNLRLQQHPTLRFSYDRSMYSSVREMMLIKVGECFLNQYSNAKTS